MKYESFFGKQHFNEDFESPNGHSELLLVPFCRYEVEYVLKNIQNLSKAGFTSGFLTFLRVILSLTRKSGYFRSPAYFTYNLWSKPTLIFSNTIVVLTFSGRFNTFRWKVRIFPQKNLSFIKKKPAKWSSSCNFLSHFDTLFSFPAV